MSKEADAFRPPSVLVETPEGLSISVLQVTTIMTMSSYVYVVVNFLSQVIFIFPLFLSMVMNANDFETN